MKNVITFAILMLFVVKMANSQSINTKSSQSNNAKDWILEKLNYYATTEEDQQPLGGKSIQRDFDFKIEGNRFFFTHENTVFWQGLEKYVRSIIEIPISKIDYFKGTKYADGYFVVISSKPGFKIKITYDLIKESGSHKNDFKIPYEFPSQGQTEFVYSRYLMINPEAEQDLISRLNKALKDLQINMTKEKY